MPRVDGFEATRAIRQNPQYDHILVVALSGDTAADDIKKMRNAGMEEQLEKPLKMDSLYDIFASYYNVSNDETLDSDDDDDYISVPITKELDGDKGLEVCGGDKDFYLEILNEFLTNYSNSAEDLKKLLISHGYEANNTGGSHWVFRKKGYHDEVIPYKKPVKAYYVIRALKSLGVYDEK